MLLSIFIVISLAVAVLAAVFVAPWMLPVCFIGVFILLLLLTLIFVILVCNRVDKTKPQEGDSRFFRGLVKHCVRLVLAILPVKIRTQGLEKVPKDGRFLMVCNHIHDLDSAVLLHCFSDSQLAFIAKREVTDYFVVGAVLHKLQCQLINRENDREALKTILKCIQMVKDDQASIMVFPEGYVSLDGKLRHFRSGVFKIAQKANVPVVVCTLKGTKEVLPRLKKLRSSTVELHLVDVIPAERVKAVSTVELAEQVYEIMIADMGEEYRTDEKAVHPDIQRQRMEQ